MGKNKSSSTKGASSSPYSKARNGVKPDPHPVPQNLAPAEAFQPPGPADTVTKREPPTEVRFLYDGRSYTVPKPSNYASAEKLARLLFAIDHEFIVHLYVQIPASPIADASRLFFHKGQQQQWPLVRTGSDVHVEAVVPGRVQRFRLHVKNSNGKTHTIQLTPQDFVERIKSSMATLTGTPAHLQHLLFNNVVLRDKIPLINYGIVEDSTIHVISTFEKAVIRED